VCVCVCVFVCVCVCAYVCLCACVCVNTLRRLALLSEANSEARYFVMACRLGRREGVKKYYLTLTEVLGLNPAN
jgi:hypothetical protein